MFSADNKRFSVLLQIYIYKKPFVFILDIQLTTYLSCNGYSLWADCFDYVYKEQKCLLPSPNEAWFKHRLILKALSTGENQLVLCLRPDHSTVSMHST